MRHLGDSMEESTQESKEAATIRLNDEKGNVWITEMKFLKVGQPAELGTLKNLTKPSRLCGCRGVCLAVMDLSEE